MKKIKSLLLLAAILVLLPLSVYASEKVNVYLFRRDGCGFCESALEFFNDLSNDSEYKDYFNLVEKEVSGSTANASLMEKVASKLNVDIQGVPFIVIGEQHFEGYTSSWNENIKSVIKAAYLNEDGSYKDVVLSLTGATNEDNNDAAITVIVILAVVAGVAFLIYMAKEDTTSDKKEEVEEKKEETKVASTKEKKAATKTKSSSTKKTTTKKASTKKLSTTKKKTTTKK